MQGTCTKPERAETKTARINSEPEQIFNTAADGMRVVDADFNVLRVNDTFSILAGMTKDDMVNFGAERIAAGALLMETAVNNGDLMECRSSLEMFEKRNSGLS